MRTLILVLVLSLLVGGCSNFYAKSDMAVTIDQNAATAAANLATIAQGPIEDQGARDTLKTYAAIFSAYAATKTTNPFTYWFGDKQILVDGEYATRLDHDDKLAQETLTRAATATSGWLTLAVTKESMVLLDVAAAKNGGLSK